MRLYRVVAFVAYGNFMIVCFIRFGEQSFCLEFFCNERSGICDLHTRKFSRDREEAAYAVNDLYFREFMPLGDVKVHCVMPRGDGHDTRAE